MSKWTVITEGNEKCSLFFEAEKVEKIGYSTILINGSLIIKSQYEIIEIKNSWN